MSGMPCRPQGQRQRALCTPHSILRLCLVIGTLFGASMASYWVARHDVIQTLAASSPAPPPAVTLDGVHLSASHTVRFRFRISGHDELNSAQWRLRPFREVVTEK